MRIVLWQAQKCTLMYKMKNIRSHGKLNISATCAHGRTYGMRLLFAKILYSLRTIDLRD